MPAPIPRQQLWLKMLAAPEPAVFPWIREGRLLQDVFGACLVFTTRSSLHKLWPPTRPFPRVLQYICHLLHRSRWFRVEH